jgi:hypothetical protein
MIYTVYIEATGQIVGVFQTNDISIQLKTGQGYVEGVYNDGQYYIENGVAVKMPNKPIGFFVFDYNTKSWIPDVNEASAYVLLRRLDLLSTSDWTQIPNNPLTVEKQSEWAVYRKNLRDITTQSGFPLNVVWPVAPA